MGEDVAGELVEGCEAKVAELRRLSSRDELLGGGVGGEGRTERRRGARVRKAASETRPPLPASCVSLARQGLARSRTGILAPRTQDFETCAELWSGGDGLEMLTEQLSSRTLTQLTALTPGWQTRRQSRPP